MRSGLRSYRDAVGAGVGVDPRPAHVGRPRRSERQVARLARFEFVPESHEDGDVLATLPIAGGAVQVLPSDAFDAEEGAARLDKKREQLRSEIERGERKLANKGFVEKRRPTSSRRSGEARRVPPRPRAAALLNARQAEQYLQASSCSACASGSTACTS